MHASKSTRIRFCLAAYLLLAVLLACVTSMALAADTKIKVAKTPIPGVPLEEMKTAPIPGYIVTARAGAAGINPGAAVSAHADLQAGPPVEIRVTSTTHAMPADRVGHIVKGPFDEEDTRGEKDRNPEAMSGMLSLKIPLDRGSGPSPYTDNPLHLNSGTLNEYLPDLTWVTVSLYYTGSLPPGAAVTGLEYRLLIENPAEPESIYCGDYEIYLFSGTEAMEHLVYDNLGGHTDGGFDDDGEDDSDIYINWRGTHYFDGEPLDQWWGVWINDTFGGDYGYLAYLEFNIYWEILPNLTLYTPPGWDGPIVASSVRGTHTDGPVLQAGDTTYIDWALTCDYADVPDTFFTYLYVDEVPVQGWFSYSMSAGEQRYAEDYGYVFDRGPHELCVMVDIFDDILELDETDNSLCKGLYWQPPSDWGDAPDPPYPTLAGSNGARHAIDWPCLGNAPEPPDPDPDGQPDPTATGDDNDGNDDESGVHIPQLVPGVPSDITIEVNDYGLSVGGFLDAWIDFDGDGAWSGGERIYSGWLPDGVHSILVDTPVEAAVGQTFGRFRLSLGGGLEPIGFAQTGEVEDHEVWIVGEQPLKWLQPPDLSEAGIDVAATGFVVLADDYLCIAPGQVVEIWVWGSWLNDYLPGGDPAAVDFSLSFHSDIPAEVNPDGYSIPGDLLWQADFASGEFLVTPDATGLLEGWMVPPQDYSFPADTTCWLYRFFVPAEVAFCQWGTETEPVIFWLDVQAYPLDPQASFGWKTSREHWNDDAVWGEGSEPFPGPWGELRYPPGHIHYPQSIDLAFGLRSQPVAGVDEERDVREFGLYPNEPNPFRETTTIRYSLAENGPVRLEIYDVMGKAVHTLVDADQPAGRHTTVWRGVDGGNRQLPSGIYFCRLKAGRRIAVRKMMYLK